MLEYWTLLLAVFAIFLFHWFHTNVTYSWVRQFPGPSLTLPFLGDTAICICDPSEISDKLHANFKTHGATWKAWLLTTPTLLTADPELIKVITSSKEHLEKHLIFQNVMQIFFGKYALISSSASQWIHDRKILNKIFNLQMFESTFRCCIKQSQILCRDISLRQNVPLDSSFILKAHYMFLMLKSLTSDPHLTSVNTLKKIQDTSDCILELLHTKHSKPWTAWEFCWKLLGYQAKLDKCHSDLQTTFKIDGKNYIPRSKTTDNGNEILKIKVDTPIKSMSDILRSDNIPSQWKYDNFMSLLPAATDTSVITTAMTLFFLALNPECQKRAHEEVDSLFESLNDEPLAVTHLSELKYVKMCIKEAMRLHPPIPVFGRTTTETIVLDGGRKIPAGTAILVYIKELHRNPEYFPNPETFDPERFSEQNLHLIKPHTYIPFSMGPRNCIGQKYSEITVSSTTTYILRNFSVSTHQKQADIKMLLQATGSPYPHVQLSFRERLHT